MNVPQPFLAFHFTPDSEGPVSKPEAPSQAEPREEPCVWEQRDPEEREILMDPDTGDGSCREPPVGVGRERSPHPSMSSGGRGRSFS